MNILVVNDDGITSDGIIELVNALKGIGNIFVVAPERQQSGVGNSMTMHRPLTFRSHEMDSALAFAVDGTPADCVKLAMHVIFKDVIFDYVFSGINHGANAGINCLYSGTIAGATEAALLGKRSIAVSLAEPYLHIKSAAAIVKDMVEQFDGIHIPQGTILNVNIPDLPLNEIRGYAFTKQGKMRYKDIYEERRSPRGHVYYWQDSEIKEKDLSENADFQALKRGYVSITPISVDRTDYSLLDQLTKNGE